MSTKYIITSINSNTVCAQIENNCCNYLKVLDSSSILGNIYTGKVENVVKNINAAFVEIQPGVKCYYPLEDNDKSIFLNRKNTSKVNIGDRILVQISCDAQKTKPATATSKISIAGDYLVLSSDVKGVVISKKINSSELAVKTGNSLTYFLKQKLNELSGDFKLDVSEYNYDFGFILRTNASKATTEDVLKEADKLSTEYINILKKAFYGTFYQQLYTSAPEYISDIEHMSSDEDFEIVTDLKEHYDLIKSTIHSLDDSKIRFYDDADYSLSKLYSLEDTLNEALHEKVWLKSGGYIIIQQTEAMTVIDVNSGKQTDKSKNEQKRQQSILKTNFEAAKEISRQLRLRNLSGIIIVDFINMKNNDDINELFSYIRQLSSDDKITTTAVDITRLGLVEMTRRKTGKSLKEVLKLDKI